MMIQTSCYVEFEGVFWYTRGKIKNICQKELTDKGDKNVPK